jgi:hypothetical protein
MANILDRVWGKANAYFKGTGTGTNDDPYIPEVKVGTMPASVTIAGTVDIDDIAPVGVDHTAVAISGQTTVTTAGTAVALGSQALGGLAVKVKALAANTKKVYVGNDGNDDVTSDNGFELSAGDEVLFASVSNLSDIYVDAETGGDGMKVCWVILEML